MWTVQMTANMYDMSIFDRKESLQMTRASIRGPAGALDRTPHAFNRSRVVCGAITSVRMCILPHRSYAYKPRAELATGIREEQMSASSLDDMTSSELSFFCASFLCAISSCGSSFCGCS